MQEQPLDPPTLRTGFLSETTFVGVLTDKNLFFLEKLLKKNFSDFEIKKIKENHVMNGLSPTHYDMQLIFKNSEDADFYLLLVPSYREFALEEFNSYVNK